jgi:hypothetical protein
MTTVEPVESVKAVEEKPTKSEPESTQTIQNSLKFDFDGSEDIAANVAAIRTMICKDSGVKKESDSEESDDSETRKSSNKRTRKTKRGGLSQRNAAESSSDEDSGKLANKTDAKRSKTDDLNKKKRESGGRGELSVMAKFASF